MKKIIFKICSIEKVLVKTSQTDFVFVYPEPVYVLNYEDGEFNTVSVEFLKFEDLVWYLKKDVRFLTSKIVERII